MRHLSITALLGDLDLDLSMDVLLRWLLSIRDPKPEVLSVDVLLITWSVFLESYENDLKVKVRLDESDLPEILVEMKKGNKEFKLGRKLTFDDSFYRWDANYHASLSDLEHELLNRNSSSDIYLRDVAELINDRLDPRRVYTSFNYIEISDVLPSGVVKSIFFIYGKNIIISHTRRI